MSIFKLNSADKMLATFSALFASWVLVSAAAGPVFIA
mgnify:FL=1